MGDFNGDGKNDLVTADYGEQHGERAARQRQRDVSGQAVLWHRKQPCSVAVGDFNGDGVKDLVTATPAANTASVLLGNGTTETTTTTVYSGLQPITGVSLATQADALLAQGQIDGYLDSVNKVSGTIGTALSRFQIAAHVASSVADVSQAAEARITDADVADNSAALVGIRSSSKRLPQCSPRRTNSPRWLLLCYASSCCCSSSGVGTRMPRSRPSAKSCASFSESRLSVLMRFASSGTCAGCTTMFEIPPPQGERWPNLHWQQQRLSGPGGRRNGSVTSR